MSIVCFRKVANSTKSAHQSVEIDDEVVGDVWREQVRVPDAIGRQTIKWRWFARERGDQRVIGRGTRVAVLFGAGYIGKNKAVDALIGQSARASKDAAQQTLAAGGRIIEPMVASAVQGGN